VNTVNAPLILVGLYAAAVAGCSSSQPAPADGRAAAASTSASTAATRQPKLVRGSPSASAQGGQRSRAPAPAAAPAATPSSSPVAERECQGKIVESAVRPPEAALKFKAVRNKGGKQMEILEEAGCLVYEVQLSVTRGKDVWAIYEVLERFGDGAERVVKVVDPPGFPCPFPECDPSFDVAKLPPDCARERVGRSVESVDPAEFPMRLEYQVVEFNPEERTAAEMWQADDSKALVLGTQSFDVRQASEKVKFCHKDLNALLDAGRFPCWLLVRLVPAGGAALPAVFSQNPLTEQRVEEALKQIEDAPAAGDEP
jgi:hypothetical protein